MTAAKPKPGIRIDGGKRRDLNQDRVTGRMAGVLKGIRGDEEIASAKKARDHNGVKQRRAAKRLAKLDGGKDGTRLTPVKIKVSSARSERAIMRCRPGSFEWRYGRNKQGTEFHAGSQLAILWERAGIAVSSSADFLRGISSGYPTGISDGRVAAIDKLKGFRDHLGLAGAERMIDYCVLGLTSMEIAQKKNLDQREMSTVLHHDLRETAEFLNFLPKKAKKVSGGKTRFDAGTC